MTLQLQKKTVNKILFYKDSLRDRLEDLRSTREVKITFRPWVQGDI